MSARSLSVNLKPDALMRYETGPLVFQKKAPPALLATRSRPDPVRVAVIGNHLPRQCGIATFTTDLCDAFAAAYGTAGLMVVAVNDPQSSYGYPARVQFEITENDRGSTEDYWAGGRGWGSSGFRSRRQHYVWHSAGSRPRSGTGKV